jgi:hypothetical protein
MTSSGITGRRPSASDSILADLIEKLTSRLQAGEQVDVEAFAALHPELADELHRLLPALEMLGNFRSAPAGNTSPKESAFFQSPLVDGVLGDYRIKREVGRGGMGIVYEAQQISLRRRVALKVLPLAAMLDPRQLERFRNEAQAAACLHHPHIVPVYAVGCERGVHYYAMQFIEGISLAAMVNEIRQNCSSACAPAALASADYAGR